VNNAYLFEGLEGGAEALKIVAGRVPANLYDVPTGPGRFTPREVIAHLADWEPRLRGRIEAALRQNDAPVEVWDDGQLALDNRYSETDYSERLETFSKERYKTIELLKSLDKSDFDRTYLHPQKGRMKVEDQAAFFMGHDLYHLDQLSALI